MARAKPCSRPARRFPQQGGTGAPIVTLSHAWPQRRCCMTGHWPLTLAPPAHERILTDKLMRVRSLARTFAPPACNRNDLEHISSGGHSVSNRSVLHAHKFCCCSSDASADCTASEHAKKQHPRMSRPGGSQPPPYYLDTVVG